MDVAAELNVTPWEALTKSVRLAAGRTAWVDEQLRVAVKEGPPGANDGEEPAVDPRIRYWLTESRRERTLLARLAKAAIDAGVAERQVRNAELEGQVVAQVIGQVIDRLQPAPEQRVQAFDYAHHALAELESPDQAPTLIEGTWTTLLGERGHDSPDDAPKTPPHTPDHDDDDEQSA